MNSKKIVVCQKWEESERGWGTRPDGYSLHLTERDRRAFVKDYWDKMPNEAPESYSRPDGQPFECWVSDDVYKKVVSGDHGIWCSGSSPLGLDGKRGKDGWR